MAAAMFMTSCTNEDDLAGGSNNQRLNSDVPIVLSAGQQANKTRASLGNVVDGKYDGTFDTPADKNLGFFCLATGKIAAKQEITWQEGNDNPNFLWLKNIQAKAVTTDDADLGKRVTNLTLFDENGGTTQTNHYYPMGSQYSYTFYGYYPYSANVVHNGNKYSVKVTGLDGTTDLIWGKSFVKPDDPDKADAYSAKYLRDKKKATKTITLKNEQGTTQVVKKADLDVLGGNFRAITDDQKKQLNISYGLEVIKVNAGKLKESGITKGFIIQRVNDNAIKTIEDLQNAVKEASTSKDPVLYIQGVYPTGKKAYFAVPLED